MYDHELPWELLLDGQVVAKFATEWMALTTLRGVSPIPVENYEIRDTHPIPQNAKFLSWYPSRNGTPTYARRVGDTERWKLVSTRWSSTKEVSTDWIVTDAAGMEIMILDKREQES